MRALFKQLLKASGTPVLQTCEGGEETILSAGNIWTSAHARRVELAERGLMRGAVLCSNAGGFRAVVDFVACTIGGFVYLPVTPARLGALRRQAAAQPVASESGISFSSERDAWVYHPRTLPAALAPIGAVPGAQLALYAGAASALSDVHVFTGEAICTWLDRLAARFATPEGGTRLTCRAAHHDAGFVADLLLGLTRRQTIYLRRPAPAPLDLLREALALGVDDLVLAPAMLEGLAQEAGQLAHDERARLRQVRLHAGGCVLSSRQAAIAASLFGQVHDDGFPNFAEAMATEAPIPA